MDLVHRNYRVSPVESSTRWYSSAVFCKVGAVLRLWASANAACVPQYTRDWILGVGPVLVENPHRPLPATVALLNIKLLYPLRK